MELTDKWYVIILETLENEDYCRKNSSSVLEMWIEMYFVEYLEMIKIGIERPNFQYIPNIPYHDITQ